MRKLTLLLAALAMALVMAVPAFAQNEAVIEDPDTAEAVNEVVVDQEGAAEATSGDANAAAGNQFSEQNQEASNEATVDQDVTQEQAGEINQLGVSEAVGGDGYAKKYYKKHYKKYYGSGGDATSGDVNQGAVQEFGDQSVSAEVDQANEQDQFNYQNSEDNKAEAESGDAGAINLQDQDVEADQDADAANFDLLSNILFALGFDIDVDEDGDDD